MQNRTMDSSYYFDQAQLFFEQNPSCLQALEQIKPGVEILITLENHQGYSLSAKNNKLHFVKQKAKNFDVEFVIKNEALRRLSTLCKLPLSEVGIEVVKEILMGHIEIKKHGSILNLLKNGYIKIIRIAGPEFLSFLATHGLSSLQKIISFIRKM